MFQNLKRRSVFNFSFPVQPQTLHLIFQYKTIFVDNKQIDSKAEEDNYPKTASWVSVWHYVQPSQKSLKRESDNTRANLCWSSLQLLGTIGFQLVTYVIMSFQAWFHSFGSAAPACLVMAAALLLDALPHVGQQFLLVSQEAFLLSQGNMTYRRVACKKSSLRLVKRQRLTVELAVVPKPDFRRLIAVIAITGKR